MGSLFGHKPDSTTKEVDTRAPHVGMVPVASGLPTVGRTAPSIQAELQPIISPSGPSAVEFRYPSVPQVSRPAAGFPIMAQVPTVCHVPQVAVEQEEEDK